MRILIVDDHALVRRGIAFIVKERFPDAEVVEAEGATAALMIMRLEPADLALVDLRMPERDGLELLRAMKLEWPSVPVIMLSVYETAPDVLRAMTEGAAGYLLKDATPEDLGQAIQLAMSGGGNLLSPRAINALFWDLSSKGPSTSDDSGSRVAAYHLTQREHQILALLSAGMSNREIGKSLYVSEKTVKSHLAATYRKLGVTNRTQAAMLAVQLGVGTMPAAGTDLPLAGG